MLNNYFRHTLSIHKSLDLAHLFVCQFASSRQASLRTAERGYCLADLYIMDRERGDLKLKVIHALQQFISIAGKTIHLHQVEF